MNTQSKWDGPGLEMGSVLRVTTGRLLAMAILLSFGFATSCSSSAEATPTPESRIDSTMNSYLDDLTELRDALTEFGNPDGSGGSVEDVKEATDRLVGYSGFFATLTDERQAYVNEMYGAELGSLLQQIANRTIGAVEISGETEIAQLVQQIPGLGATRSESSR